MASKQDKKKQAIRQKQSEIKSGSAYNKAVQDFRDEKVRFLSEVSGLRSNLASAEREAKDLLQDSMSMAKTLQHERKMREEIQNGAVAAKESLQQIRQMHVAFANGGEDFPMCRECLSKWPCPTILAIREPLQATIAALQILERELRDSGQ